MLTEINLDRIDLSGNGTLVEITCLVVLQETPVVVISLLESVGCLLRIAQLQLATADGSQQVGILAQRVEQMLIHPGLGSQRHLERPLVVALHQQKTGKATG